MATVDVANLAPADKDELVCTYAALLLHDCGLDISAEKLNKVIKQSGNEVEAYWPGLFAKALQGQDIDAILTRMGAPAAAGPVVGGEATAPADEKEKVENKKDDPESDVSMVDIFGGDDDY